MPSDETLPDPTAAVEAPRPRSHRRRALKWAGGILVVLAVLVAAFLILFDWNHLRGPIGRYASMRTGRVIELQGELDVKAFSLQPSATVRGLKVGHPEWAGAGDTALIPRLDIQIKALPLLVGRLEILRLEVAKPRVALLRDAQGRTNWDFSNGREKDKPTRLPLIRRFVIDDGRLTYADAKRKLKLDATINAREKVGARNRGFQLVGRGGINGAPFMLDVTGGALLNIKAGKPYPFDADIRAGSTRVTAKGAIPKPFDLGEFAMNVTASGRDLANLYDLTGVALPNTPPYKLNGRMSRDGTLWTISGIGGRLGDTDLAGVLSVETAGERPFLKANLKSRSLDFDDLATFFGAAPAVGKGETASPEQAAVAQKMKVQARLLPDATLNVEKVRSLDADVTYAAAAVRDAMLPLRSASVRVKLDNGLLRADPVDFDLPQGRIAGSVQLNARNATPVTSLDLRISNARLEQLILTGGDPPLTGGFVGRIKLSGAGSSVHRAAANADGEVLAVVPGGEIRKAFAELLGINVTKGLGLLLTKNETKTDVRCAVAHFQVKAGVMRADQIVFDTGPVLGKGKGTIDLETERMNFTIEGHPKKARLISLSAPITVSGPITGPKIGVQTGGAIAQGGFATLLATVASPLAAVLPFVDLGLAKDAACGAMIADARAAGVPVKTASTVKPAG